MDSQDKSGNDRWIKSIEERLTVLEMSQLYKIQNLEEALGGLKSDLRDVRDDFKNFKKDLTSSLWKVALIFATPTAAIVVAWVLKGGLASIGVK